MKTPTQSGNILIGEKLVLSGEHHGLNGTLLSCDVVLRADVNFAEMELVNCLVYTHEYQLIGGTFRGCVIGR
jgi:hypothetical protein